MPSAHSDLYLGACWDEFSVDGALANICGRVERQLREVVGSTILMPQDPTSYTSRRSKDDRPFIERFFGTLARAGVHRLSTTTGSKPADKHGADPDEAAIKTQFQIEYLEELLDTIIANYNATPHSGLGHRSPLAQLDFLCSRHPEQVRQADPWQVARLAGLRKLCTLHGGAQTGRRPYFNFASATYSAEWLMTRTDLLGKELWLQLEDDNDARWAAVSTKDGQYLPSVRAAPPWHLTPHTVYVRQSIRALERRRLVFLSTQCDAVEELIKFCESSEGKKLPVHPAYLETRRVLRMHAEALTEQSMVGQARATAAQAETDERPAVTARRKDASANQPRVNAPPAVPATEKPDFPKMQMAKTW